jgi:hypothetical protein
MKRLASRREAAEREIMAGSHRGALHGIPFGLKDNTRQSGSARPVTPNSAKISSRLRMRHCREAGVPAPVVLDPGKGRVRAVRGAVRFRLGVIEEVRFAIDSPLEGSGFELSVPLERATASNRLLFLS